MLWSINCSYITLQVSFHLVLPYYLVSHVRLSHREVPRSFLYGQGEKGEGRKGLVNILTPTRIHGCIPAVSVDGSLQSLDWWAGLVGWTGGLDWWAGLVDWHFFCTKITFVLSYETSLSCRFSILVFISLDTLFSLFKHEVNNCNELDNETCIVL